MVKSDQYEYGECISHVHYRLLCADFFFAFSLYVYVSIERDWLVGLLQFS